MDNPPATPPSLSLALYRKLVLVRKAEERIIAEYSTDEMKSPMHMSMGQEAIPVAVCAALNDDDSIWVSYRSHAAYLAKTGDIQGFFAEMYGRSTGTARGKAGSMHLSNPDKGHMLSTAIVASSIAPAIGMAFANKQRGKGQVSCTFFGDGAVDEGVFWESLNAACAMRLPVLFVCEDNGIAVHAQRKARQGFSSIPDAIAAFDCDLFLDESNDVESLYRTAAKAIAGIRETGRPAFLHATCYRYLEHVGVNYDFQDNYRPIEEFEAWKQRDSILVQHDRLLSLGQSDGDLEALENEADQLTTDAVLEAARAPFPGVEELFHGVFHEDA